MKKSLFLLSLISVALTACSSSTSEPANNAEVVDASTAWQTDVQPTAMPSSMSQPSYQPTYQPQPQPLPSYTPQPLPAPTAYSGNSEMIGSCNVVRDGAGKPIYTQIQKGCYTDSQYTVGVQDTLFLIGYLTGTSADHIAQLNGLNPAAKLPVGKVLRVR